MAVLWFCRDVTLDGHNKSMKSCPNLNLTVSVKSGLFSAPAAMLSRRPLRDCVFRVWV